MADSKDIKEAVRTYYAGAAARGCCEPGQSSGSSCRATFLANPAPVSATIPLPHDLAMGCGSPLASAGISPGAVVVDLGCGAGSEAIRAATIVRSRGLVVGVDLTDEMLSLAQANRDAAGVTNVAFVKADIERLPVRDRSVDVMVSNCVLNLAPDKTSALAEALRVLVPGGRFVVADMVREGSREPDLSPADTSPGVNPRLEGDPLLRQDLASWSACIGGALTESAYVAELRQAGFVDVRLERISSAEEESCCGGSTDVLVASYLISARKSA